jgi:type I restriction enzyme R subunit
MDGKAMIVCMSRRICIDLYNAIVLLRPHWHHADDDKGAIKVVMTGSAVSTRNTYKLSEYLKRRQRVNI